jgi:hypothetical protein
MPLPQQKKINCPLILSLSSGIGSEDLNEGVSFKKY